MTQQWWRVTRVDSLWCHAQKRRRVIPNGISLQLSDTRIAHGWSRGIYCSQSHQNARPWDRKGARRRHFHRSHQQLARPVCGGKHDATNRRLGNGASFYGRRKSRFYGEMDSKRKVDPSQPDALEDFQAPLSGGYYQWMPDEDGQMRPVTRMKNKVVERNPNFWDRAFDKDSSQK
jgi:hypothetical protein